MKILTQSQFITPFFELVLKQSDNAPQNYYVLNSADSVIVLALYEQNIIFVNQFRYTYERSILELPSGHIDAGETPEQAAARELLEETGYKTSSAEYLGYVYPDTGRLSKKVHLLICIDVEKTDNEPESGISVQLIPMSELKKYIVQNKILHAQDLACINFASLKNKIIY
ncbi:MAG: NUDIX hydrolase [Cytophagales bacterium]|nr:NUDIX hydrolase [Cytophagales bacterium]